MRIALLFENFSYQEGRQYLISVPKELNTVKELVDHIAIKFEINASAEQIKLLVGGYELMVSDYLCNLVRDNDTVQVMLKSAGPQLKRPAELHISEQEVIAKKPKPNQSTPATRGPEIKPQQSCGQKVALQMESSPKPSKKQQKLDQKQKFVPDISESSEGDEDTTPQPPTKTKQSSQTQPLTTAARQIKQDPKPKPKQQVQPFLSKATKQETQAKPSTLKGATQKQKAPVTESSSSDEEIVVKPPLNKKPCKKTSLPSDSSSSDSSDSHEAKQKKQQPKGKIGSETGKCSQDAKQIRTVSTFPQQVMQKQNTPTKNLPTGTAQQQGQKINTKPAEMNPLAKPSNTTNTAQEPIKQLRQQPVRSKEEWQKKWEKTNQQPANPDTKDTKQFVEELKKNYQQMQSQPDTLSLQPSEETAFKLEHEFLSKYYKEKSTSFLKTKDYISFRLLELNEELKCPEITPWKKGKIQQVCNQTITIRPFGENQTMHYQQYEFHELWIDKKCLEAERYQLIKKQASANLASAPLQQSAVKASDVSLTASGLKEGTANVEQVQKEKLTASALSLEQAGTTNQLGQEKPNLSKLVSEYSKEGFVARQTDFYFGDNNYHKDKYIQQHTKNNEGLYMELRLLLNFPKIKNILKDDFSFYQEIIRTYVENNLNKNFEVNQDCTLIRKKGLCLPSASSNPKTNAAPAKDKIDSSSLTSNPGNKTDSNKSAPANQGAEHSTQPQQASQQSDQHPSALNQNPKTDTSQMVIEAISKDGLDATRTAASEVHKQEQTQQLSHTDTKDNQAKPQGPELASQQTQIQQPLNGQDNQAAEQGLKSQAQNLIDTNNAAATSQG